MPLLHRRLQRLSSKKSRTIIGLMSGTSINSIDVAICNVRGYGLQGKNRAEIKLRHFSEFPYDKSVQKQLRSPERLSVSEIAAAHVMVGELFARAARYAVKEAGLSLKDIDLVGSHGQTIFHHSGISKRATLQIGCGATISQALKLPVVYDFRSADIAAGGEGAPLTPYGDAALFSAKGGSEVAVLNLGGIGNVTFLHKNPSRIVGFDTGPANAPLDRLAALISRGRRHYDLNGEMAKAGKINKKLLSRMIKEDPFLRRKPPKSTGFEMYGDRFVSHLVKLHGRADYDLMATVVEYVAISVSLALKLMRPKFKVTTLILAGGGSQHPLLFKRIAFNLPGVKVIRSDALGVPWNAREAMAFTLLANDALFSLGTNIPAVTGAKYGVTLGSWVFSGPVN